MTSKTKLISAVTSAKTYTDGHKKRVGFLHMVKEHFVDWFDWYGRGVKELGSCKLAGLQEYKYHIVLENGSWPHYWTEKLADAYVANCYPFYWGAPNINEYFDDESYIMIDVEDPVRSIGIIEQAIKNETWEKSQFWLSIARAKVAHEYNPFEVYRYTLAGLPTSNPRKCVFHPHTNYSYSIYDRVVFRLDRYSTMLNG